MVPRDIWSVRGRPRHGLIWPRRAPPAPVTGTNRTVAGTAEKIVCLDRNRRSRIKKNISYDRSKRDRVSDINSKATDTLKINWRRSMDKKKSSKFLITQN